MRAKVLILDNYDSFTYNLAQYLEEMGTEVIVYRNDELSVAGVRRLGASHIVISPGPGRPESAGISCELISKYAGVVPILGVCLGHQAIGLVMG
ncbi:MAG: anthranilate/aminodeoxychorismate synthase component II, partial [Actinobacteria bacterium]|nr:anthranilate/aminodeoxychorismate synthase component II [Actinomycetota bacterium]